LEDIPSILFVDELLEMYPNAKVILTNRDIDSWLLSMNKTFFTITEWKTMPYLAAWELPSITDPQQENSLFSLGRGVSCFPS